MGAEAVVIAVSAFGIPDSPHCWCGPSLEKNAGLIHKAAMMGREERRKPVADRPDRAKFSGTAEMKCFSPH